MENDIRSAPTDISLRWGLFQTLCLLGQWERALKQLQVCAKLDAELVSTAQVMRDLIRSEMLRAAVFQGKKQPGHMVGTPPSWLLRLLDALSAAGNGDVNAADVEREEALSAAPEVAGESNLGTFTWITESDSRLGPVCEMVVADMYRWCPFSEIATLNIQPPHSLLDLIWTRAEVSLRDGSALKAYLPVRYPGSELADGAIRLSRESRWREEGKTGVFGLGQKTWMTDVGDVGLLDLRVITFAQNP
ncbi:type VI secretion system accessory protein TagJ [Collimonas sp. NPDC087041]|uniref:type VI secretion system accessory protein TagJ n=1 Tax=Collimonas sp. NPDC087041 TaxID=3363960 RepID=UPI00382D6145